MSEGNKTDSARCSCSSGPEISGTSCCGQSLLSGRQAIFPWITGMVAAPTGKIPQIAPFLSFKDRLGAWKARWNINRMNFLVPPGLYALGNPDGDAPVLVTANYKMSFDNLRCQLAGRDLWILVLDTKGINVWCAAGKGTFGTEELVNRIARAKLNEVVEHRILILPQLGAPGVAAHEVQKLSGFKVIYGPVRAADLPVFLDGGFRATERMREVRFGIVDRLVVVPVEITNAIKPSLWFFAAFLILNILFYGASLPFFALLHRTIVGFLPFLGAILTGAALTPLLLPYIPGRAFAWKGWLLGIVWTFLYIGLWSIQSWSQIAVYVMLLPAIASFLAMNFTGASTYTSLSGVVREMKPAVPFQIISAGLGILILIAQLVLKL